MNRVSMKRFCAWLCCCVLASVLTACGEEVSEPVAELQVEPTTAVLGPGGTTTLTTRWQMEAPLEGGDEASPHVFVHLLDSEGRLLRTFDHPLPFAWQPGEQAAAELPLWLSVLDPSLPAGAYPLRIGLYDRVSGRKWPVRAGEGQEATASDTAVLSSFEVRAPGEGAPAITFPAGWYPPHLSEDLQVLARRWMESRGQIRLAGLPGPVRVALRLHLTDLPRDQHSLVFLDEQGEAVTTGEAGGGEEMVPSVTISSPCAAESVLVEGFAIHPVDVVLQAPAGGECVITLTPNFLFIESASFNRRSVQLERLTWTPLDP